uniref:Mitochondrial Hsp70 homolog n=1 Tax=Vairimorpha necatrix TaxID=6039 RepID=O35995_9MICR|nr:mitochondrial Hsp70 homolog [Vairimorpha necatrix]
MTGKEISSRIIGIDLGTTNSCVSLMHNNVPHIIENEEGTRTTPSVVSFSKDKILVGDQAKQNLTLFPKNTIFASKRLIGRKFDDLELKEYLKNLPYDTTRHCNGDVWIKIDEKKYSPAQIGAFILSKMKNAAETFLNSKVVKSVVTVPAYFDDMQRQATKDAGRIAGLEVLRVVNEPTAAALAYGLDKSAKGIIAVYDLGGGTFDISILELDNGIFHVKSTNGNTFLGGEDLDNKLVDYINEKFKSKTGIDLLKNENAYTRIKEQAEKIKRELSTKLQSEINIPYIYNDKKSNYHLKETITRDEFEKISREIINKTIDPCIKAMRDANITKNDIKHCILVGGMTRMPYVRKLVKKIFGITPSTNINPDEAVAKGAALQAGVLEGKVKDILLLDVVPLSLGIELLGGVFNKIIHRNSTVPFKKTHSFSTSEDNQSKLDIRIYQGERKMVKDNKYLGAIKLKNIPSAPAGIPKIEVTFEADANGIYKVSAQDGISKNKQEIEIVPSSGLNEEEIKQMVKEAKENEEKDERSQKIAEVKIEIRKILEKRNIKEGRDKLEEYLKQEGFDIEEVKNFIKSKL